MSTVSMSNLFLKFLVFVFVGSFSVCSSSIDSRLSPDVSVLVRKHNVGADIVEVTVMHPNYPEELLASQCESIGKNCKGTIRGLRVFYDHFKEDNPKLKFRRATFAVDGLIDNVRNIYRIEPV
jgi:hypothetical protein